MNISRVLSELDECDRASFCEAIADASHYVATALDVLPASDHFSFPELCSALNYLNSLNGEIEEWQSLNKSDDSDDALDFSGIEKAIAAENPLPKQKSKKTKKSKNEFFGHAKALNAIKKQAKAQAAKSGGGTNV